VQDRVLPFFVNLSADAPIPPRRREGVSPLSFPLFTVEEQCPSPSNFSTMRLSLLEEPRLPFDVLFNDSPVLLITYGWQGEESCTLALPPWTCPLFSSFFTHAHQPSAFLTVTRTNCFLNPRILRIQVEVPPFSFSSNLSRFAYLPSLSQSGYLAPWMKGNLFFPPPPG